MKRKEAQWYVISPEGGSWVAIKMDDAGRMICFAEEANSETHRSANDHLRWVCDAIANGEVDENVNPEVAAAVVAAWDEGADPTECCVERIVAD
jgi:hypothetical protein